MYELRLACLDRIANAALAVIRSGEFLFFVQNGKNTLPPRLALNHNSMALKIIAVIAATTALIQLSFPPGVVPFLALVCWVPCFLLGFGETSGKILVLTWFAAACVNWLINIWSLQYYPIEALEQPVWLSRLLLLFIAFWSAIPYAIAAFLSWKWLSVETCFRKWLQPVVFTVLLGIWPIPFPGGMYLAFYKVPSIFQWAAVGGSMALNFWIFLASFVVARVVHLFILERIFHVRAFLQIAIVFAATIIPGALIYAHWCEEEEVALASGEKLSAVLVQPAIPPSKINRIRVPFPEDYRENDIWLIPMSKTAKSRHPELELVVWPEVPIPIGYLNDPEQKAMIDTWMESFQKPLLFCSTERAGSEEDPASEAVRQAVHLLTPGGDHQQTSKKNLIPFSEYLPLEDRFPAMRKLFPKVSQFKRGTEWTPLDLGSIKLGPMVCYDDMFPGSARRWKREGADILISLSNDSWFGDTRMQDIRLAAGMLCAVETRLPWLRAENAGYTLACFPSGRLVGEGEAPLFKRDYVSVDAPLLAGRHSWRMPECLFIALITFSMLALGAIDFWFRSSKEGE